MFFSLDKQTHLNTGMRNLEASYIDMEKNIRPTIWHHIFHWREVEHFYTEDPSRARALNPNEHPQHGYVIVSSYRLH